MAPALFRKLIRHRRSLRADAQAKASEMPCRDAQCRDTAQKRGGQRKRKICKQSFSFLRPGHSATQFVAQKTHSYLAVPVGRISQGTAVFCVRNASISHIARSMPSPSTSRTSALRRAVDGVAPPLSLQVPGPRGAEEVAQRTQRRRKRLARTDASTRVVGGVRRAGADGL